MLKLVHGMPLSLALAFDGVGNWDLSFKQSDETIVAFIHGQGLEASLGIGFAHLEDAGRHFAMRFSLIEQFVACIFQLAFGAFH